MWVGTALAFWVGVMGSWVWWCVWSCSMVWSRVLSVFGMGHRGFTVVEVLWVFFFFFPPVGFYLVAEIHLPGFRQGRSANYLYKASHIRCIYHRHFDYTSWIVVTY